MIIHIRIEYIIYIFIYIYIHMRYDYISLPWYVPNLTSGNPFPETEGEVDNFQLVTEKSLDLQGRKKWGECAGRTWPAKVSWKNHALNSEPKLRTHLANADHDHGPTGLLLILSHFPMSPLSPSALPLACCRRL